MRAIIFGLMVASALGFGPLRANADTAPPPNCPTFACLPHTAVTPATIEHIPFEANDPVGYLIDARDGAVWYRTKLAAGVLGPGAAKSRFALPPEGNVRAVAGTGTLFFATGDERLASIDTAGKLAYGEIPAALDACQNEQLELDSSDNPWLLRYCYTGPEVKAQDCNLVVAFDRKTLRPMHVVRTSPSTRLIWRGVPAATDGIAAIDVVAMDSATPGWTAQEAGVVTHIDQSSKVRHDLRFQRNPKPSPQPWTWLVDDKNGGVVLTSLGHLCRIGRDERVICDPVPRSLSDVSPASDGSFYAIEHTTNAVTHFRFEPAAP